MAQKISVSSASKTKVRRRGNLRPLNTRKSLGPKSSWRGVRKKKRGQG